MPNAKTIIRWIDRYLLLTLSGFLLGFIPLYPKLPLFDVIPGYIVRVRLEDIFIALTSMIWLIQILRKKISWHFPTAKLFTLYLTIGFFSLLSAIFVTKTIPLEIWHVGKSSLHLLRYLEYFTMFFIIFSVLKTRKQLKILLAVSFITLFAVFLYGVGQRYLYWPVYSTMNREFSKGLRLYLTPHARVQSTFAGHYDLGGYIVISLPFVLAAIFSLKKNRLILYSLFYAVIWLIVVSASRASFASLVLALTIVVGIFSWEKKTLKKKIAWFARQILSLSVGILLIMALFGQDMYERLLQVLESFPTANHWYQQIDTKRQDLFAHYLSKKLTLPSPTMMAIPKNGISTDEAATFAAVLVPSDERPTPQKPSDVYVDVPVKKLIATTSADGVTTMKFIDVERTYSENALKKGLSLAIRLDSLWPQALAGFYRNPLLGSGYATLTKTSVQQFTEAESTDNNYLRTLGETGLAGFISFYGIIVTILFFSVRLLLRAGAKLSKIEKVILVGFTAGSLGLLLNAVYIDVFVASKIAQIYWAYAGMVVAIYTWNKNVQK